MEASSLRGFLSRGKGAAARLVRSRWAFPVGLGLLAALAYGLLLPWLGFYWDDWPKAWFLHVLGPTGFLRVYQTDRPILGWFYLLTTPWLGEHPIVWQSFGLGSRWLAALLAGWVFRKVWPDRPDRTTAIALLILVFPSFRQQFISLIYSHYLLLLAIHLASIGLTLEAIRRGGRRIGFHAAALIGAVISLFSIEYFIGLEILRLALVGVVLQQSRPPARFPAGEFLRTIAPYLGVLLAYVAWRVLIVGFPTYQPLLVEDVASEGAQATGSALLMAGQDLLEVLGTIWVRVATPPSISSLGMRSWMLYLGVTLASAAVAYAVLAGGAQADVRPSNTRPRLRSTWTPFLLGVVAVVAAGLPVWVPKLPMGLDFPWDRLTLPMIVGAPLTWVGLAELALRPRLLRTLVLSGAVALSAGWALQDAVRFRRDWDSQRDFFYQLAWRAPAIETGTVLVTNDIPFVYESDNSLTAPVNWIYADGIDGDRMSYLLYFISVRNGRGWPGFAEGLPIHQRYRATVYDGTTSEALAVLYDPPGCVQVLDEVYHDSMPTLPALLSRAVPLSHLGRIDPTAAPPWERLAGLFGPPPAGTWCEFFERADLARQQEDWETVTALGDVAFDLADRPNDASEWLPFIEAYAREGRVDRSRELTDDALEHNQAVRPMLCNTWRRLEAARVPEADSVLGRLGCEA